MPEVSVVVPLYNEPDNVARLCAATHEALARMPRTYELVLVVDASAVLEFLLQTPLGRAHFDVIK